MHRLLATLLPTLGAISPKAPPARACRLAPAPEADAPPEPPGACGWFDSSHALQHGLRVTEHANADTVSAALPLDDWLQLHLGAWSWAGQAETAMLGGSGPH